jgi:hypothetical protein
VSTASSRTTTACWAPPMRSWRASSTSPRAPSTTGSRAIPPSPRRCARAGSWRMGGWRAASTSGRSAGAARSSARCCTTARSGRSRMSCSIRPTRGPASSGCATAGAGHGPRRTGRDRTTIPAIPSACWPSSTPRANAPARKRWRNFRPSDVAPTFWPTPRWAQAARFLRASPMPSQLEPMNMRSMPRKMPSV